MTPDDQEIRPYTMIGELWRKSMMTAREAGETDASAVEDLIRKSREILTDHGFKKRDADSVLFGIYIEIHWDWNQPTDRVFESMLDTELAEYYKERGLDSL